MIDNRSGGFFYLASDPLGIGLTKDYAVGCLSGQEGRMLVRATVPVTYNAKDYYKSFALRSRLK